MINMVSDLEARISCLELQHAEHHFSPYVFDDVTFAQCDLQKLLATQSISNMVGQVDSKSHVTFADDERKQGIHIQVVLFTQFKQNTLL